MKKYNKMKNRRVIWWAEMDSPEDGGLMPCGVGVACPRETTMSYA